MAKNRKKQDVSKEAKTKVVNAPKKREKPIIVDDPLTTRSFGYFAIECSLSNPNGDPDEGGGPRTTYDQHGLIAPVCTKSKFREILSDPDSPIFKYLCQSLALTPADCYCIWESPYKGFDVDTQLEAINKAKERYKQEGDSFLCKRYWDIRLFGTCSLENTENGTKKDALNIKRTGVVVVSPSLSILPVELIVKTMIKSNPLRDERLLDGNPDPAPQAMKLVRHAVYVGCYTVNPSRAHYTGTTNKDVEIFKALVPHVFSTSTAANRANVRVIQAFHADHNSPLCSFDESEFLEFCKPQVTDPKMLKEKIPSTSLNDYTFRTLQEVQAKFPGAKVADLMPVYKKQPKIAG
jgi:CRISPR-associated protein Csd2